MQPKTFTEWLATPLGFISVLGGSLAVLLSLAFLLMVELAVLISPETLVPGSVRRAPTNATGATALPTVLPTPESTADPAPNVAPTESPAATPEPAPAPEPVPIPWPQGQIVLAVFCPEGWCIVAMDPVSGHRETIASFSKDPFEVHGESGDSPTLRSRHDPAFARTLHVNNYGSTIFGWVDRLGNVTDLYDKWLIRIQGVVGV